MVIDEDSAVQVAPGAQPAAPVPVRTDEPRGPIFTFSNVFRVLVFGALAAFLLYYVGPRAIAQTTLKVIFAVALILAFGKPLAGSLLFGLFMLAFYVPAGYYIDLAMWRRRERARIRARQD
jgi:ABC-type Na+ efflux pump permease subunit